MSRPHRRTGPVLSERRAVLDATAERPTGARRLLREVPAEGHRRLD
jgi:hypothetical protein